MALALYRKYRPRTFAEVIGQEHVTEPLSQALRTGRLNHAYLFSGPRGCGKTSSARILARSLNCERGPTPDPCGVCASCVALAPDGSGSIDVIEIDAASHGGVDDARDLRERAIFAPVSSRFKVYVIDEAHMVSSAGFNALLKLVEEPPDYVKFVFATTEPEKVLGTIKSRTHHYPFRLIPPGVLRPYLEQLCSSEGVKVEPAVFPLVVRAGGGSARDTLSILDQLIAGASTEGVSYSRAVALLGVTDVALIDEMCDGLAAGDGRTAYGVIDSVVEAGHDPRRFASDLLERLRDLIVLQQVPDAVTKGLLDAPEDQLARMSSQASRLGSATLSRFADIVHNGLTEMRGTTAPRLLLELIVARMLLPGAEESTGSLLQRLERLERRLTATGFTQSQDLPGVPTERPVLPHHTPAAAPVADPQPTYQATPPPSVPTPPDVQAQPAATRQPSPQAASPEVPAQQSPAQQSPAQQSPAQVDHAPGPPMPIDRTSHTPAPGVSAAPPQGPPLQSPAGQPAARPPAAPGTVDVMAVRQIWDDVLSIVSKRNKKTAALVREATVRDVEGDTLVLLFKHTVHATMLSNSPDTLVEALSELIGGRWKIRCEIGEAGGGGTAGRPASPPPPSPAPSQGAAAHSVPDQGRPPQQPTSSDSRAPRPDARSSGPRAAMATQPHGGSTAPGQWAATEDDDWPMPAQPGGPATTSGDGPSDAVAYAPSAPAGAGSSYQTSSHPEPGSRAESNVRVGSGFGVEANVHTEANVHSAANLHTAPHLNTAPDVHAHPGLHADSVAQPGQGTPVHGAPTFGTAIPNHDAPAHGMQADNGVAGFGASPSGHGVPPGYDTVGSGAHAAARHPAEASERRSAPVVSGSSGGGYGPPAQPSAAAASGVAGQRAPEAYPSGAESADEEWPATAPLGAASAGYAHSTDGRLTASAAAVPAADTGWPMAGGVPAATTNGAWPAAANVSESPAAGAWPAQAGVQAAGGPRGAGIPAAANGRPAGTGVPVPAGGGSPGLGAPAANGGPGEAGLAPPTGAWPAGTGASALATGGTSPGAAAPVAGGGPAGAGIATRPAGGPTAPGGAGSGGAGAGGAGTTERAAPRRSAAVEQARAAAARAGAAARARKPVESAWDGPPDEPPWDPEFDGPVGADPQYPGFDPGDEPMDDATPGHRETSEEAALRLLTEALGAEKIGETAV